MRFILQMARREIRSSWKRLLFFFLCIAIGVGSIVAIRSVIRNFNNVFTSDARSILGADVQLDSTRPWNTEVLSVISRISAPMVGQRAETIEAATMLRPADAANEGALMVELKGIEPSYPLYGEFKLQDAKVFS